MAAQLEEVGGKNQRIFQGEMCHGEAELVYGVPVAASTSEEKAPEQLPPASV